MATNKSSLKGQFILDGNRLTLRFVPLTSIQFNYSFRQCRITIPAENSTSGRVDTGNRSQSVNPASQTANAHSHKEIITSVDWSVDKWACLRKRILPVVGLFAHRA